MQNLALGMSGVTRDGCVLGQIETITQDAFVVRHPGGYRAKLSFADITSLDTIVRIGRDILRVEAMEPMASTDS